MKKLTILFGFLKSEQSEVLFQINFEESIIIFELEQSQNKTGF